MASRTGLASWVSERQDPVAPLAEGPGAQPALEPGRMSPGAWRSEQPTSSLERVAVYSMMVNVFLIALNLVLAAISGSLALAAEVFHSLADLISSVAVVFGLKLSKRKHRTFPYGLYKIENLIAIVIALFIFFTA